MKLRPISVASLFLCFIVTTFTSPSSSTATGDVSINCGSVGTSAARNGREWVGDVINPKPKSPPFSLRGSSATSAVHHRSSDPVPHGTARISRSQFSYEFEVGPGQKLIRLHFHSATYTDFKGFRDLFTVEAGPFTLLSNFSASLAAYTLGVNSFSKDFCLSVQENELLNITFSPEASSSKSFETYAFVNGIEIISVPAGLSYIQSGGEIGVQVLGQESLVFVDHHTALELIHTAFVVTGAYLDELGKADSVNNESWRIPVDVGFTYMIRLHLSGSGDVVFRVLINEMIALTNFDIVEKKRVGNKILWYKDCVVVMMRGHKMEGRRDLLISLQSYDETIDGHGFLAGFEVFKLSNADNSLASPNPLQSKSVGFLISFLGRRNAVSLVVVTIISLVCIIVHTSRGYWEANCRKEENKPSERAERLCRRFSLAEIQLATGDFSDRLLIGRGGFGKVYKGLIDRGQTTVAVKRLKSNSMQGAHEFLMEIETLSELRHFNLVSLIGYCNEQREMILVYDYMSGGTLSDCLYKLQCENNDSSSLTWKQRLNICIGAGRGLDYLHTGHGVIHRDVKTSNILLDENLVAKVSDFGLAKHEDRGKVQSHISTRVKGTRGYLDPHYLQTRKLTRKTDTYAFGVVLFEVLCGRKAVDSSLVEDEHILTIWAREKISRGEIDEIVDLSLRGEISLASLKAFVGIAEKCLRDEPKNRPTIAQVVQQLDFALEQQDNGQVLVSNEITSASDDIRPSNEDLDDSINVGNTTLASTHEQRLTPLLEEQANSQQVNTGLSPIGRDGRKDTTHKPSRLWPWDAFWSRVKPSKKNDLSSETNARIAEIWDETSIRSTMFDWDMIAASTNQFSIDNQLGRSRFSSVYKCVLPTGQELAVKRISSSSKNIIKLLGYCIRGEKLLTVYEFLGNQSLDTFITGQQHFLLQWDVRFKIIMGIARGVVYLHQDSGRRVIHRNLNTSNILLDLEMNPKISNFGIARDLVDDHFKLEILPAGTNGYTPPECASLGNFSVESDVYSFGVIILRIVSGQRSIRPFGSEPMLLKDYASDLWKEDRAGDLVDESLGGAFPQDEALRFIHVGLLCTQWEPNNRPTMPSVLKMLEGNELLVELQRGGSSAVSSTSKSNTATEIWDETCIRSTKFDWDMIAASTNQFSLDHKFGGVYKGVLPTGQEVAVKRHGLQEFKNVNRLLPNLLHRNIIKLLGYCIRRDEFLIVYEFIGNKSLDTFITGQQQFPLQWDVRFKIIMGIAHGVLYLHQDSGRVVIHRNLKTSNILLDHEMNPKISNFSTARALADYHSELETQLAGTHGYIPPECSSQGEFSVNSDVYSFGVMILEIVSGKRSMIPSGSEPKLLQDYAWELCNEGRAGDLVDESIDEGAFPEEEALRFIQVGLLCTQKEPNYRPTMPSVLKMLEGNKELVELQLQLTLHENFAKSCVENTTWSSLFWETVAIATDSFSDSNKVEQGRFGSVYQGLMPTGQLVTVTPSSTQGLFEFRNAILLLPKLQHQNIIKLLGYCINGRERLLVYEFLECLTTFIFGLGEKQGRQCLAWPIHFKIIKGIAQGVAHMHKGSGPSVACKNLTSGDILLDSEMNPKVSSFELAGTIGNGPSEIEISRIASKFGYVCQEHKMRGRFNAEFDVFSFGIIVLEIISGKKILTQVENNWESMMSLDDAWRLRNSGKALDMVNESIMRCGEFSEDEALRCIYVGLICAQYEPDQRPTIHSVLNMLLGDEDLSLKILEAAANRNRVIWGY